MPNNQYPANWSSIYKLCVAATNSKKLTALLVSRWKHFETYKGKEWLVNRAKTLLNIAKLQLDDRNDEALHLASEESIKVIPGTNQIFGPEGIIIRNILYGTLATKKRNMLVLRFYTGLILASASEKQINKVFKSINAKPSHADPKIVGQNEWMIKNSPGLRHSVLPDQVTLELRTLGDLKALSSYPRLISKSVDDNEDLPFERMVGSLLSKGYVPQSLLDCYPDEKPFYLQGYAEGHQSIAGDESLGKIVLLQEGGAKGRAICSPNAWIQFYMNPLHVHLSEIIDKEESVGSPILYGVSAVKNQPRGVYAALELIKDGGFCASADLSGATDRFPLYIQQSWLRANGLSNFANAFDDLKGPYTGVDGNPWFYTTGQPMGIYGSFPLFHLTHLFVLRKLCAEQNLSKDVINFAVLGDDVIFFDEGLHQAYRKWMKVHGVSISEQKSFNRNFAEFASCIIPRNGKPYRPYKWGARGDMGPIINTLNALGSRSKSLGKNFSELYDLFISTVGKRDIIYAPLVPDDRIIEGVNQQLTVEYFKSLVAKLESRSSSQVIHSLVTPGLINSLDSDLVRLVPNQNELGTYTFDPLSYKEQREWHDGKFLTFMKDPLILQAKAIKYRDSLQSMIL